MKSLLASLIILLAVAANAQIPFPTNVVIRLNTNGQVSLAWDAAPSHTNLASFGVLVGVQSGIYNVRHETPTNNTTFTVTNLPAGIRFYFAVVARNVAGIDSDPSNEINYTIPKPAPTQGVRTTYIDGALQSAPFPTGPWTNEVEFPSQLMVARNEQRFYRLVVNAVPGPLVKN